MDGELSTSLDEKKVKLSPSSPYSNVAPWSHLAKKDLCLLAVGKVSAWPKLYIKREMLMLKGDMPEMELASGIGRVEGTFVGLYKVEGNPGGGVSPGGLCLVGERNPGGDLGGV